MFYQPAAIQHQIIKIRVFFVRHASVKYTPVLYLR
jgi:hypothetical protein